MTSRPTYHHARQTFSWAESARALGWTPGAPVSLGRTIIDRHAGSGRPALRWFGKRGEARTYTFDELARLTDQFANVLRAQGVGAGDRVAGFLPRVPEMLVAMIGAWKAGAVYVPIFTGFGPDAIDFRVRHSGARVLCTHWEHRARLPAPWPDGPTLLRAVMALGASAVRGGSLRLRSASSCGEPLNAEVVSFFREHWGVTVMDQYGSSEFGLPIGNFGVIEMAVKPGSMGLPLPGCTVAVVDDGGREVGPEVVGHVGMKPHPEGYYSLGYWNDADRDREMYRGDWMTVGDLARRDADGYFWFEGRADDVIKSAGYRIGPFEVESAILKHEAVAEAAVVGKPDSLRGQIVKAYVVLKPGRTARGGLETEIADVVKAHVGRHQYPREIEFLAELPKTETGKIQRFLLRRR